MADCTHSGSINDVKPKTPEGCEECLRNGTKWVQLRLCLGCGHVGCCDSSIGKHARKHYEETKHPIIEAYPGKEWRWCYIDGTYLE